MIYYTANQLVNPDKGIFMPMDEIRELQSPDEHMQRMAIVQERLFKLARDNLKRHDDTNQVNITNISKS